MNREHMIEALGRSTGKSDERFDLLIVGGGATGAGIAVDAASRGYRTALVEQSDFGKGTSSRSTKLVHGGVRYLQQGNVALVIEALRERGRLRRNAPHLVSELPFVVPNYAWWEAPFYGLGMKVYDALAGRYGFGSSGNLSQEETIERLPTIETEGLRGGVLYHDGQFDDTRLLIHLMMTAVEQGAVVANYCRVTCLTRNAQGFIDGALVCDEESGVELEVGARLVINATGPFSDAVRRLDDPAAREMVRPSQGVHLVLPRDFLPGSSAIMVPHTDDGRVLFAVPWHGVVIVGTTDTPVPRAELEPTPQAEEVDFLLAHTARYLKRDPQPADLLSVFAGIRPLVSTVTDADDTAKISREHILQVSASGLLSVLGGKWTTYRKMAEDAVDLAATLADLEPRECVTKGLPIHGHHQHADRFGEYATYGSDAPELMGLLNEIEGGTDRLDPALALTRGEVVWAARREMARSVEDVLARRSRSLLLNAAAAARAAPATAALLAEELGRDEAWCREQTGSFRQLVRGYLPQA